MDDLEFCILISRIKRNAEQLNIFILSIHLSHISAMPIFAKVATSTCLISVQAIVVVSQI